MKRNQNTFYNGKNPTRTLKIMREDNNVGFGNKQAQGQTQFVRKRGNQKIDFSKERIKISEDGDPTPLMNRLKLIEQ